MPRKKKENIFPDYVRVRYPDMAVLAALTKKAIGPNRSVTEFAEACGLAASTISRILNEKFTNPVSDGVIAAIAKNADPESGVTLEDLLAVHGLIPIVYVNEGKAIPLDESVGPKKPPKKQVKDGAILQRQYGALLDFDTSIISKAIENAWRATNEDILPRRFREIIQNALVDHGYSIELLKDFDIVNLSQFRYKTPFTFITNAVEIDGLQKWAFDIHDDIRFSLYQKISWIFGTAYLESPYRHGIKVSLVTMDTDQFNEAKEKFSTITIPDCISIILVDITKKQVMEEYQIKQLGTESHASVLTG